MTLPTVPGQSRSITFLHDARADIPAMDAMVKSARCGEFDLLVCYTYDRLVRSGALPDSPASATFSRLRRNLSFGSNRAAKDS